MGTWVSGDEANTGVIDTHAEHNYYYNSEG